MANSFYPQELIALVQEYLTDGIISAKERQVLLKKAQQLGVDVDEFDLYIDAQQQKADSFIDAAASKKRGKTCPFCGGTVPQLSDKCPHCGETITPEASEELQDIFDHLEEALVDFKSGKDIKKSKANVERYVRKAKMYYENNPKVAKLLAEVQEESVKAGKSAKVNAINAVISKNKKLIIGAVVVVVVVIGFAVNKLLSDPKRVAEVARAHIEKGEYEKAEAMLGRKWFDMADEINFTIQTEFIKAGQYDRADNCIDWLGEPQGYCEFLYKCIDDMKSKNAPPSKLKSFIDRKIVFYANERLTSDSQWKEEAVRKRLYKYAGIYRLLSDVGE